MIGVGERSSGRTTVLYVHRDGERLATAREAMAAADDRLVITTTTCPETALERLTSEPVDCLLVGNDFPDTDAVSLIERARATNPDLPIVLWDDGVSEADVTRATVVGLSEYFAVSPEECDPLVERLHSLAPDPSSNRTDERSNGSEHAPSVPWPRVADNLAAGVAVYDRTGRFVYASSEFEAWFGVDPQRPSETAIWDCSPVVTEATFDAYWDSLDGVERARIQRGEVHDWTVFELATSALTVDSRTYHVVTAMDQSEQFRHRQNGNILEAIFESVPVNLYVKDPEGRHVRVSERLRHDDAGEDDVIGKTDLEVYEMPDAKQFYEDDMRVLEDGEQVLNREEFHKGTFSLASKVPLRTRSGEIQGLLGLTRDITEIRANEQRLERQNERLRTFATVLAHDIRNPLQVATGQLTHYGERLDDENLFAAEDALEEMGTLLEGLLGMIRHGKWIQDPEMVSIQRAARRAWDEVGTDTATLEVDPELVPIKADEDRLQVMLEELFANAIEHGGSDVTVRMGHFDFWDGIFIEDDGAGIPTDERDAVFDAGYTTVPGHAGLGATTVEVISESHGWDIDLVESEDGGARIELIGIEFSSDRIPVETTAKHAREAVDADGVTLRFDPEVDSVDAGEDLFQGLFELLVTNARQRGADTIRVGSLDFETGLYVEDDGASVPHDERDGVLEAECRQTDTPDGVEAMSIRALSQAHDWNVELTDSEMGGARFEFSGITFY